MNPPDLTGKPISNGDVLHRTKLRLLENKVFRSITAVLDENGLEGYVIGGFVRDLLMGRPSKDVDVVVVGSGIDLAERVAEKLGLGGKVSVFRNFGTAMFVYRKMEVEFVGARKESYDRGSRKPVVEAGSLEDDQRRRDFTINALAISLNQATFGKLLDPFGGLSDLSIGVIRTPLEPGITFSDDPLRILRAVRFATQLGFSVHPETLAALKENGPRLEIISKERIADELNKIIMAPKPSVGWKLLADNDLLPYVFPEMEAMRGIEEVEGKRHKDNFLHTLQVLDQISRKTDNLWLRWAALLHDIAKPATKKFQPRQGWTFHGHEFKGAKMVPELFRKMKLPLNEKMKYVQKLVLLHLRPIVLAEEEVTDSAIRRLLVDAGDQIEDLMTLAEADITSKNDEKVRKYLENFQVVRQKLRETEARDALRNWQPPITGEIIMETFGMNPCRAVGDIKTAVREAILDGVIENDFQQAFQYMVRCARQMGFSPVEKPSPGMVEPL